MHCLAQNMFSTPEHMRTMHRPYRCRDRGSDPAWWWCDTVCGVNMTSPWPPRSWQSLDQGQRKQSPQSKDSSRSRAFWIMDIEEWQTVIRIFLARVLDLSKASMTGCVDEYDARISDCLHAFRFHTPPPPPLSFLLDAPPAPFLSPITIVFLTHHQTSVHTLGWHDQSYKALQKCLLRFNSYRLCLFRSLIQLAFNNVKTY